MLDIFAMFFTFGALLFEAEKKVIKTGLNKNKAIEEHRPYYFDGNNKKRSTETGEIVVRHDGKLLGAYSNHTYYDYEQQMVDEKNKKRKQCGSPVYMCPCKKHFVVDTKDFSRYHLKEIDTNRFYRICSFPARYKNGEIDYDKFLIEYLDDNLEGTSEFKKIPNELKFYYQGFYD